MLAGVELRAPVFPLSSGHLGAEEQPEQALDRACGRNRKDTSQYDQIATLAEMFRISDEYG
jgi:hypothetical protein